MSYKVAVLIGSLRAGSLNRKIAEHLVHMGHPDLSAEIVTIGELPLYNEDLDVSPPHQWQNFRASIKASDALLFVTPEYNRSVPGVLKNAIDVGSRPEGKSVWDGKPAGVITVSPGSIGGFGANHHLRQMFVFLNVYAMQQPECYLGQATDSFEQDGGVLKERTGKFLTNFVDAYARWIRRFAAPREGHGLEDHLAVSSTMFVRAGAAADSIPAVK
jgi:chromate reductase